MDKVMERFQALSMGEKIILVAGVVLLIASFLPWYSIDLGPFGDVSRNGWQSPGQFWSIIAVFIGIGMAGVVALKIATDVAIPDNVGGQSWGRIHLGAGIVAVLFLIIKFINENDYTSFGFYLGFLAAIALAAGGALLYRDEGGVLPGMPSGGMSGGGMSGGGPPGGGGQPGGGNPPPAPPSGGDQPGGDAPSGQ